MKTDSMIARPIDSTGVTAPAPLWHSLSADAVFRQLSSSPGGLGQVEAAARLREGILSRTLWFRAGITGAWMARAVLLTFIVELRLGYPQVHARTLALTMFAWLSFFQVFSARAESTSLFRLRLLANRPLLFTSLGALVPQARWRARLSGARPAAGPGVTPGGVQRESAAVSSCPGASSCAARASAISFAQWR